MSVSYCKSFSSDWLCCSLLEKQFSKTFPVLLSSESDGPLKSQKKLGFHIYHCFDVAKSVLTSSSRWMHCLIPYNQLFCTSFVNFIRNYYHNESTPILSGLHLMEYLYICLLLLNDRSNIQLILARGTCILPQSRPNIFWYEFYKTFCL